MTLETKEKQGKTLMSVKVEILLNQTSEILFKQIPNYGSSLLSIVQANFSVKSHIL